MLEESTKYDEGKTPLDLLSPYFLQGIAEVLKFGAEKYAPYNWAKGIKYSRVFSAMQRHLWAFWCGEDLDPDSEQPHLWHAGCCLMFLIHYEILPELYKEFNDTPTEIYKENYTAQRSRDTQEELSESRGFSREDFESNLLAFSKSCGLSSSDLDRIRKIVSGKSI